MREPARLKTRLENYRRDLAELRCKGAQLAGLRL
jgi:hypothetical protein